MGRAERRRLKKYGCVEGAKPTKTIDDFLYLYNLSFVVALDSENIDRETAARIIKKVYETADCLDKGYINQADVEKMCDEAYGLVFIKEYKKNAYRVANNGAIIGG